MTYDTLTREFEIYSENFNLVGYHTIQIQAYFKDYPLMTSLDPKVEAPILIEDPCKSPFSLTAP